jgi:hypothetical protein
MYMCVTKWLLPAGSSFHSALQSGRYRLSLYGEGAAGCMYTWYDHSPVCGNNYLCRAESFMSSLYWLRQSRKLATFCGILWHFHKSTIRIQHQLSQPDFLRSILILLSQIRGDYRRGLDSCMYLLTTYIHHSELQIITTLSLISTLYKLPQYLLSLFSTCCTFISRSLATASNSGDSSASRTRVRTRQPPVQYSTLNWQLTGSVRVRVTLRLAVSQCVLVSSPIWGSWPEISYCLTVTVLSLGGHPLWREHGSVVCQSGNSIRSIVSIYNFYILHVSHVIVCIYNIYKASVSPGSVQQIMPYFW